MGDFARQVTDGPVFSSEPAAEDQVCLPDGSTEIYGPPASAAGPVNPSDLMCALGHNAEEFPPPVIEGQYPIVLGTAPPPAAKPKAKKKKAAPPKPKESVLDRHRREVFEQADRDTRREVDEMSKRPLPPMTEEQSEKYFMPEDLYAATRGKSPEEKAQILRDYEQRQMVSDEDWAKMKSMTQEQRQQYVKDKERKMRVDSGLPPDSEPPGAAPASAPTRSPGATPRGVSPPPR